MPPRNNPVTEPEDDTPDVRQAAVGEATAPKGDVSFELDGETYWFNRKRLNSIQFEDVRTSQSSVAAVRFLLGTEQWRMWAVDHADEDGDTSIEDFNRLSEAIGKANGLGNGRRSSRR